MFRRVSARLCAVPAAAMAPEEANALARRTAEGHPYHAQWTAGCAADSGSTLASPAYAFLQARIDDYRGLMSQYAVKQTEVERARKAAAMCGLEMTGSYRGPRRGTTDASGAPAPSFSDQVRAKKEATLQPVLDQALEAERADQQEHAAGASQPQ